MAQKSEAQGEKLASRIARTTGQELLFLLAIAFVFGFGVWWYQAWATLISPPSIISPQGIFTVMISAVYALVLPLFWSMLLPSSPAGWLLQQQTWAYPGQMAVMVASIVLSYFGGRAMYVWLVANGPALAETGMFYPALGAALVGAYLVPALQFAYMTPTQQLVRIKQAHEIKKLKILHGSELAVLETRLIWLKQKALVASANLLPASDLREVLETQRALFKSVTDSQRRIALTSGVSRDVMATMGLLEDEEVDESMQRVEAVLLRPAEHGDDLVRQLDAKLAELPEQEVIEFQPAARSVKSEERGGHQDAAPAFSFADRGPGAQGAGGRGTHQDAAPALSPPSPSRPVPSESPQRPAAPRSDPQRYPIDYAAARNGLREWSAWTVATLADVLNMKERTARDRVNAWVEEGVVEPCDTKGRFNFTESWEEHVKRMLDQKAAEYER